MLSFINFDITMFIHNFGEFYLNTDGNRNHQKKDTGDISV